MDDKTSNSERVLIEDYRGPALDTPLTIPDNARIIAAAAIKREAIAADQLRRASPSFRRWSRWVGSASIVGGLLWAVAWILEAITTVGYYPHPVTILGLDANDYSRLIEIPIILLLLAATGFHLLLRRSYGSAIMGWAGFVVTVIALTLLELGVVQSDLGGRYSWIVAFPLIMIGQLIWGVASLDTRMLSKWVGGSLLVGGLIGMMSYCSYSLFVIWITVGLPWIIVGYTLWRYSNAAGNPER